MVKLFATVMWAVGAAASRNEGTALLQGLSQELGEDRNAQLLSMKEKVLAFADAGVPEASKEFLQQIESLLKTKVLEEILAEKNTTEETEKNDLKPFQTAEETYTSTMTALRQGGADLAAVYEAKGAHTDCRGLESTDYGESEDCKTEQGKKQKAFTTGATALTEVGSKADVCDEGWHETKEADLETYVNSVQSVLGDRKALDTQIATCNRLDKELNAKKDTCDDDQATYESLACTLAQDIENAAHDYNTAYGTANTTIQRQWALWKVQSDDRIRQCQLVNTIICYVKALELNDDKAALESAISDCDTKAVDCSAYAFTAQALPVEITLDAVPAAPCGIEFDYGVFPAGTAKAECTECTLKR